MQSLTVAEAGRPVRRDRRYPLQRCSPWGWGEWSGPGWKVEPRQRLDRWEWGVAGSEVLRMSPSLSIPATKGMLPRGKHSSLVCLPTTSNHFCPLCANIPGQGTGDREGHPVLSSQQGRWKNGNEAKAELLLLRERSSLWEALVPLDSGKVVKGRHKWRSFAWRHGLLPRNSSQWSLGYRRVYGLSSDLTNPLTIHHLQQLVWLRSISSPSERRCLCRFSNKPPGHDPHSEQHQHSCLQPPPCPSPPVGAPSGHSNLTNADCTRVLPAPSSLPPE